jgi:hypothetical protein
MVDEMGAVQRTTKKVNYLRWSVCHRRSWPITLAAPKTIPSIFGTNRFSRHAAPERDGIFMNRRLTSGHSVGHCQAPSERSQGWANGQNSRTNGGKRIKVSQPSAKSGSIRHIGESGVMEAPQMAFNDNAEHVRILSSVRKGIDGVRRRMQELQPELSTSASEAVNVARQELCTSLIQRMMIAEKEARELQDMLELNQKAGEIDL